MNKQRREESENVNKVVSAYLEEHKRLFPEFIQKDDAMWDLFEQKAAIPGIRSYVAHKLYTLSGGQEWETLFGPLLGIIEMSIISSYATNRVFDKKSGGKTDIDAMKSIMTSALARDGIYHMLHVYYDPELINRLHLWHEISDIQRWFYLGQYINSFRNILPLVIREQNEIQSLPAGFEYVLKLKGKVEALLHDNIAGLSGAEIQVLTSNQFLRLYLINAHFYERFASLSVRMSKSISDDQESLLNGFGALYGVGTQIINDVIDFALPSMGLRCAAKSAEDFFSDLRNMTITFPMIFGLYSKKGGGKKEMFSDCYYNIEKKELSDSQKEKLLYYLLESKSIQISLKIASLCLEEAKKCLNESLVLIPDNALMDIFRISHESRFVVNMFRWYRGQRRSRIEVAKTCQTA